MVVDGGDCCRCIHQMNRGNMSVEQSKRNVHKRCLRVNSRHFSDDHGRSMAPFDSSFNSERHESFIFLNFFKFDRAFEF